MKYWHPHLPFGQHIAVSTLVNIIIYPVNKDFALLVPDIKTITDFLLYLILFSHCSEVPVLSWAALSILHINVRFRFLTDNFFFFPQRESNTHPWYTAAPLPLAWRVTISAICYIVYSSFSHQLIVWFGRFKLFFI